MTKNKFRALIIFNLLLLVVSTIIAIYFNDTLPPALNEFIKNKMENEPETVDVSGLILALIALTGIVGLLFFTKWSRPVFLFGVISTIIITIFTGPTVLTAQETFIYELSSLIDGVIITLSYFSEVKIHFDKKNT